MTVYTAFGTMHRHSYGVKTESACFTHNFGTCLRNNMASRFGVQQFEEEDRWFVTILRIKLTGEVFKAVYLHKVTLFDLLLVYVGCHFRNTCL